jgi:hypothetical protein
MNEIAVITGDIVASRELPGKNRENLFTHLEQFMVFLKDKKWLAGFELFRGDSLQCVPESKQEALRVALMIRAWMKSYSPEANNKKKTKTSTGNTTRKGYFSGKHDIRLSIGIAEVDFYKNDNLAHSDGRAFHLSGQGLDALKDKPERLTIQTANQGFNETLEAVMLLLDAILEKWTSNQAEVVFYKLQNLKEDEIAKEIGISQPAVSQRTKTSKWNAIEKLLSWFEKTIKDRQL